MPKDESHERKCWECGNVAIHKQAFTPEVLCKRCGSQDTRRTKPETTATKPDPQAILNRAIEVLAQLHDNMPTPSEVSREEYMVWRTVTGTLAWLVDSPLGRVPPLDELLNTAQREGLAYVQEIYELNPHGTGAGDGE